MNQALHAMAFIRLLLEMAGGEKTPIPAKPRRRLKARRRAYCSPARINPDAPILGQLRSGIFDIHFG